MSLPILEGDDEAAHYAYVRYLARLKKLPTITAEIHEAVQPPLYYLLGAVLAYWIPEGKPLERNPYWGYQPDRFGVDNKPIYVHSPDEGFPYKNTTLAVHLVRLLSVAFSLGVIGLSLATCRLVFAQRPCLALSATAFVAFLPGYLGAISVVSNDSLAILLATAMIYLTVRGVCVRYGWREALALGLVSGLIVSNKLTTTFIIPPAFALLSILGKRDPRDACGAPARRWRMLAPVWLLPMIVVPLPWLLRNYLLYGEPTGLAAFARVTGALRSDPLTFQNLVSTTWFTLTRFFVGYGAGQIPAPPWVYWIAVALTSIAAIGLVRQSWRRFSQRLSPGPLPERQIGPPDAGVVVLLTFSAASLAASFLYIVWNVHGARPRLFLYPSLPAIAPVLVMGWSEWAPTKQLGWRLALMFVVAAFACAVLGVLTILRPAFSRPLLSARDPLPARTISPPIILGDNVALIGGEVTPTRAAPGQEVVASACWQALRPSQTSLSEYVHIVDPQLNKIAERETYPGLGRLSSVYWAPGDRFCDHIRLTLREWAGGPALLPVVVGFFDATGALPAYSEGALIKGLVTVGYLAVAGISPVNPSGMIPYRATYSDGIDLLGYQVFGPAQQGSDYTLRLYWRTKSPIAHDLVVFVHWLDNMGEPISLSDSVPRGGLYPTSAWGVDEIIADDHPLPISRGAIGASYFEVGLYFPHTLERLPVTGGALTGDAVILPGPVLP